MQNLKNEIKRGFTLVEFVVVIAILAILAAAAVPMVDNFLERSKGQAYSAEVAAVQAAVNAYYSAPGNTRFLSQRQFPLNAANSTGELDL